MDHSLIYQFNIFFSSPYYDIFWRSVEFIGSFILFITAILQRINIPAYTQAGSNNFFFRIMGQTGLYFQALLSLFMMVDSFDFDTTPHIFIIMFMISALLVKGKIYCSIWGAITPGPDPIFDSEMET